MTMFWNPDFLESKVCLLLIVLNGLIEGYAHYRLF
jgi:hypothetical protein